MMNVVKNTMIKWVLDLVCPHICMNCGRMGEILCECCKNNILKEQTNVCPLCKKVLGSGEVECGDCDLPFLAIYVVGWRAGVLAKLTKDYKYKSLRAAGEVLAELLDRRIGDSLSSGDEVVVVPLPTIGKHVRQRGFDHTADLAKKLAMRMGWHYSEILGRATDVVQVGASMQKRQEQAATTYCVIKEFDTKGVFLLVDDVWTSGASMLAAEKVLRAAGAKKIAAAVVMTGKPELE